MSAEPFVAAPCPLCGKARQLEYRPFCSKRCADLDLSRWFNGVYAVPAKVQDEEDSFDLDPAEGAGKPRDLP